MIALLILFLLTSCLKTEVLNTPIEQVDTVMYQKPYKLLTPKEKEDTTRTPITFNPSVEDWKETNE